MANKKGLRPVETRPVSTIIGVVCLASANIAVFLVKMNEG
jgi:hypothetical protein